jgi:hypothetical protein
VHFRDALSSVREGCHDAGYVYFLRIKSKPTVIRMLPGEGGGVDIKVAGRGQD